MLRLLPKAHQFQFKLGPIWLWFSQTSQLTRKITLFIQHCWIWNSIFWLGVKNLENYRQHNKIKNKSYIPKIGEIKILKCYLFIFMHFQWKYSLWPKIWLSELLVSGSRCEDLILLCKSHISKCSMITICTMNHVFSKKIQISIYTDKLLNLWSHTLVNDAILE